MLLGLLIHVTAVSCSPTCFVRQQVGDAPQLFRDGARPHHRPGNLGVFLNHPAENHLSHIQVDTQTAWSHSRT